MLKQKSNEAITLNEKLLNEFSTKLKTAINTVCNGNSDIDPRLELLITLGTFSAQVSIDCEYSKEDFLTLMSEIFDEFVTDKSVTNKNQSIKIDISKLN